MQPADVATWSSGAPFRFEVEANPERTTTGRCPVTVREGGSIGAVPMIAREFGIPVHFLPLSLPDHGYHAPNEYFDWRQARIGIGAFPRVFTTLSR